MTTVEPEIRSESARGVCANCGAPLVGRWCHDCGQDSKSHNRKVTHLAWEAVEGLFHLDGRLMSTLPELFFRPGRLARDYLEGRLARHMPPFRTFLAALVIFLFAAEVSAHRLTVADQRQAEAHAEAMKTPQGRAVEARKIRTEAAQERAEDLADAAADRNENLADPDMNRARAEADYARETARVEAHYQAELAKADRTQRGLPEPPAPPRSRPRPAWARAIKAAARSPEAFWSLLFEWGHRLAVLLLPVVGLTLALVYRNRPEIYLHDHLLVAMNLMSFGFLANAVGFLLPPPAMGWWLGAVALWTPVNLFQTLRGGYGSGLAGAIAKTLVVWTTSVTAFGLLLVAAFWLSASALAS